jgi:hypothetical protein
MLIEILRKNEKSDPRNCLQSTKAIFYSLEIDNLVKFSEKCSFNHYDKQEEKLFYGFLW